MHQSGLYWPSVTHVCADVVTMALGTLPLQRGFTLAKRARRVRRGATSLGNKITQTRSMKESKTFICNVVRLVGSTMAAL